MKNFKSGSSENAGNPFQIVNDYLLKGTPNR